jgi:hypothetical protein
VAPSVSPNGCGDGTWELGGLQARGQMGAGAEDVEDETGCCRPGLHLGASPPLASRRRVGAAAQSRRELLRFSPTSAAQPGCPGPWGIAAGFGFGGWSDPLEPPRGVQLGW